MKHKELVFFVFLVLVACATQFTYYSMLKNFISTETYDKAEGIIEENKLKEYGEKNALIYWLDKGIVLHYAGKYEESISAFDKAEKLADELYTKSVSEEASTFLVSDNTRSYSGEDFEKVFINVFQALNYLLLGKNEDALVEARKVDHKLKTLQVDYGGKNVYKEDAFMRYLTGLLYESQNEFNDAFVSYRKAIEEYSTNKKIYSFEIPQDLLLRSLKVAKKLRFKEEFDEISSKYKLSYNYKDFKFDSKEAEAIIFCYLGFAPYKIDHYIEVTFGEGWMYVGSIHVAGDAQKDVQKARQIARSIASNEQFLIAFPKFVPSDNKTKYAIVNVYDDKNNKILSQKTYLAEDIETIAIKNLEDRIAKIRIKAIARAAIKYALSRELSAKLTEKSDDSTKWLVKKMIQTTAAATEQADKRSWRTLPKEIQMATLKLPEGDYNLEILFYDNNNNLLQKKTYPLVKITSGKKTFIISRCHL